MTLTRAIILSSAALALTAFVGCDKSIDVDAVSVSDANGKTLAFDDDPTAVYLDEDGLQMPVEVAFRATGENTTTGSALDLDDFEMTPCASSNCTIAKPGSCSGEVCTVIVRWSKPGFCAFETRVSDNSGHSVGSSTHLYVGANQASKSAALDKLGRTPGEEVRARCSDQ